MLAVRLEMDVPMIPVEGHCSQGLVRPHRWDRPMAGHGAGVCTPDTMVGALVRGFTQDSRQGEGSPKPWMCRCFHGVLLGNQHAMWSKQHNGKVSSIRETA